MLQSNHQRQKIVNLFDLEVENFPTFYSSPQRSLSSISCQESLSPDSSPSGEAHRSEFSVFLSSRQKTYNFFQPPIRRKTYTEMNNSTREQIFATKERLHQLTQTAEGDEQRLQSRIRREKEQAAEKAREDARGCEISTPTQQNSRKSVESGGKSG